MGRSGRALGQLIQDGIAGGREALDLLDELGFARLEERDLNGLTLPGWINQNPFQIEEPERFCRCYILPTNKTLASRKGLGCHSLGGNGRGAESGKQAGADD